MSKATVEKISSIISLIDTFKYPSGLVREFQVVSAFCQAVYYLKIAEDILREAEATAIASLQPSEVIVLSSQTAEQFITDLENPREPSKELREAVARYLEDTQSQ